MAAVGYRNHPLQSRVPTTYGYNPLELAGYAEYADAAEANPRESVEYRTIAFFY